MVSIARLLSFRTGNAAFLLLLLSALLFDSPKGFYYVTLCSLLFIDTSLRSV